MFDDSGEFGLVVGVISALDDVEVVGIGTIDVGCAGGSLDVVGTAGAAGEAVLLVGAFKSANVSLISTPSGSMPLSVCVETCY